MALDPRVYQQLDEINIIKHKPLIISDADEVLVHFAKPLELFLDEFDMSIAFTSYKLFGNVRYKSSNEKVPKEQVFELLQRFFIEKVHTCPAVEGVCAALERLSENYQIIILSNTPYDAREQRIKALNNIGINFPLIANDGHKGPAVKALYAAASAQTVFLDDIPHHHTSVATSAPEVQRIHFVADQRLAKLLEPATDSHTRIDNWREAETYIENYFKR